MKSKGVNRKGFTLLEILLVIAAIGILAAIVIVAINPQRQLALVRNTERSSDINSLGSALDQYLIDNGGYPGGISNTYQEVCVNGEPAGECVDLDGALVPSYLARIPADPNGGGYQVAINPENGRVSLRAEQGELDQDLVVNPFVEISFATGEIDETFTVGTGFNNHVLTTAIQSDEKVIVGGRFTTYQGVSANRIIRLNDDGSRDTSFDIGSGFSHTGLFSTIIDVIKIQNDGSILVGGAFASYQGIVANNLIRLNSDGSRDLSFNLGNGINSRVHTINIQSDGKILVGGVFSSYQEQAANRIVRLNSDGTRDTSFNEGSGFTVPGFYGVSDIQIQSDGKIIVVGNFSAYDGNSVNRIIRLNSDGSRDTSFDIGLGLNSRARTTAIQSDGRLIVGGGFTSYQGVSANRIVRVNGDGSRDTSFNIGVGFDSEVVPTAIQSDGKVVVGGWFSSYQGVSANGMVRLSSDGSRDASFDIGSGFNGLVQTIAVQSDGKVIVGGSFTTYQDQASNRLIRLQ